MQFWFSLKSLKAKILKYFSFLWFFSRWNDQDPESFKNDQIDQISPTPLFAKRIIASKYEFGCPKIYKQLGIEEPPPYWEKFPNCWVINNQYYIWTMRQGCRMSRQYFSNSLNHICLFCKMHFSVAVNCISLLQLLSCYSELQWDWVAERESACGMLETKFPKFLPNFSVVAAHG